MTLNSTPAGNIKMQDSHPKISVVLTTWNRAAIVPQAIDSILCQTFKDFELIIVNDGSTDKTQLILEDYAQKDSRIKILVQKNSGVVKARNRGVEHANGKYIALMDDDDLSHPQRLEKQLEYLVRHPEKDACVCLRIYITGNKKNVRRIIVRLLKAWMPKYLDRHRKKTIKAQTSRHHNYSKKDLSNIPIPWPVLSPDTMINKSAFNQCGGYRPFFEYGEDFDFTLRYEERFRRGIVPEYLYEYTSPYEDFGNNKTTVHCDPLRGIKYITVAYISAWYRRNGKMDPIAEEASDLENVLRKTTHLPARIRHQIFECLNYELSIFLSSPVLSVKDIIVLIRFLKKFDKRKALRILYRRRLHLFSQLLKRGKILDILKLIRFGLTELFFSKDKKENDSPSK